MYLTTSSDLQDEFARRLIGDSGSFLDIGCGHGRHGSNTYILEKLGWTGLMIDNDDELVKLNRTFRRETCVSADVTKCHWDTLLYRKNFDYLSFDVDDATTLAVQHFPWDTCRFRVITIEHDAYRVGGNVRQLVRQTLNKAGYFLLAADVMTSFAGQPFEDWWVDPKTMAPESYLKYFSVGKLAKDILYVPR
jgi:SAM-dependent methyltransferase